MKILVGISKAPDTTSKINFTDNNTQFDANGVQFIVNPYDEWYALVRAIELKEKLGGTVTTITVGEADADPVIRKALAIGADDAVRVNASDADAFYVANEIAHYAKENGFDLVMVGKETINYNGNQIGGMVAEIMNVGYVSNAVSLELDGSELTLERDIQGGTEVVKTNTPAVVSAAKGMAEQRIPNMRGIMAARTKKLTVVEPVGTEMLTEVVEYAMPAEKSAVKLIDAENIQELVDLLHKEAKVI